MDEVFVAGEDKTLSLVTTKEFGHSVRYVSIVGLVSGGIRGRCVYRTSTGTAGTRGGWKVRLRSGKGPSVSPPRGGDRDVVGTHHESLQFGSVRVTGQKRGSGHKSSSETSKGTPTSSLSTTEEPR